MQHDWHLTCLKDLSVLVSLGVIKTEQEVQSDHLLQFSILILFPIRNGKIHNESNIHNKCTHSIHNH